MWKKCHIIGLTIVLLTACQSVKVSTGMLAFKDAWARPAAVNGNGAVYLVIENGTDADAVLLSASSEIAQAVELHASMMNGDQMNMQMQETVAVPAGQRVEFAPGGLHIMLVGLARELKLGDTFNLTLKFDSGEQVVTVTVKDG